MAAKPAVLRKQALKDVQQAAAHYSEEGGLALELRFIDALQASIRKIAAHPAMGSPRYAQSLSIPGLRLWRLTRFPYLMFYLEREDAIDVLRVLHEVRDIPSNFSNVNP
jgi:toxin ParE1/3/4